MNQEATVSIPNRFCGPPSSANGGYTCGVLSEALGGCVEVTLKSPPPLQTEMAIVMNEHGAELMHGDNVVAIAKHATLDLDCPTPPTFEHALKMTKSFTGYDVHSFPTCFVCGPQRNAGDGLRIFSTKEHADAPAESSWVPDDSICGDDGLVSPEIVWASLDCPGYFGGSKTGQAAMLGRMTAKMLKRPKAGERCVLLGWALGEEGRKIFAASALYGEDKQLYAFSKQTWIVLKNRA